MITKDNNLYLPDDVFMKFVESLDIEFSKRLGFSSKAFASLGNKQTVFINKTGEIYHLPSDMFCSIWNAITIKPESMRHTHKFVAKCECGESKTV